MLVRIFFHAFLCSVVGFADGWMDEGGGGADTADTFLVKQKSSCDTPSDNEAVSRYDYARFVYFFVCVRA